MLQSGSWSMQGSTPFSSDQQQITQKYAVMMHRHLLKVPSVGPVAELHLTVLFLRLAASGGGAGPAGSGPAGSPPANPGCIPPLCPDPAV